MKETEETYLAAAVYGLTKTLSQRKKRERNLQMLGEVWTLCFMTLMTCLLLEINAELFLMK